MKILIVEDDFLTRTLLQNLLKPYGHSDISVDGQEAVEAMRMSLELGQPYDLVCLDVMMPKMDGQEALKRIRELENSAGISPPDCTKIVMMTVLDDKGNIMTAFREQCDAYLVKPVDRQKLLKCLETMNLV